MCCVCCRACVHIIMWASYLYMAMSLFSLIHLCLYLFSLSMASNLTASFSLSMIIFRGITCTFWRLPHLSLLLYITPVFILSVSLRLLVTCGHVCMTKEMQSVAQAITIFLVCTIYMKNIFIHDMHARDIASLSLFPPISYMLLLTLSAHLGCALFRKSFKW